MGLRSRIPTSTGAAGQACVLWLWPADIIWLARQFLLHLQLPFTLLLSCGQSQPLYEPGKTEHELSDASSPAPPLEHSSLRHAVFLPNLWLSSLWNGCAAPVGVLPFSLRVCFQGEENRAWRVNVWQLLPSAAKVGPYTHPQKYSS